MRCLQSNELTFKKKGCVQLSIDTFLILVLEVWKSLNSKKPGGGSEEECDDLNTFRAEIFKEISALKANLEVTAEK